MAPAVGDMPGWCPGWLKLVASCIEGVGIMLFSPNQFQHSKGSVSNKNILAVLNAAGIYLYHTGPSSFSYDLTRFIVEIMESAPMCTSLLKMSLRGVSEHAHTCL